MLRHEIERQIDPTAIEVLADVTENVRELHGVSERLRTVQRLLVVHPEELGHQAPHRAGDAICVAPQLLE